jgi:CII-binding regulator of phage lambda lysogenization HflD
MAHFRVALLCGVRYKFLYSWHTGMLLCLVFLRRLLKSSCDILLIRL